MASVIEVNVIFQKKKLDGIIRRYGWMSFEDVNQIVNRKVASQNFCELKARHQLVLIVRQPKSPESLNNVNLWEFIRLAKFESWQILLL